MLQICRFFEPGSGPRLAAVTEGRVYDLPASGERAFSSLVAWMKLVDAEGMQMAVGQLMQTIDQLDPIGSWNELLRRPEALERHLLPPLDFQEVWGAGVTYFRSRQAREDESDNIGIYDKVYNAERPEIFFKATPNRVVGSYDTIRARSDSNWSVPEPELTVVLSPKLEIVGYTAGNDVSSRDIEGDNPLYLPQAKIFTQCCALGPAITLPSDFDYGAPSSIELTITRRGDVIVEGQTSTDEMKRTISELVMYLGYENEFPSGVFLMTGTGVVPPDDYTLRAGDVVEIVIKRIGRLVNYVSLGG